MKNIIQFPESFNANDDVSTQAAYWIAKLDGGLPKPEVFKDFMRWKTADPKHAEAYKELSLVWSTANKMQAEAEQAYAAPLQTSRDRTAVGSNPQSDHMGFALRLSFAASLIIGICLLVVSSWQSSPLMEEQSLQLHTLVGEQQRMELSDGSELVLNTDSRARVEFSPDERRVYLTHGEAHFEIAHNPDRPFKVYTALGNVRAVGTAFSVDLSQHDFSVTVTHGRIAVSSAEHAGRQKNQPLALADAGQQVVLVNQEPQVRSLSKAEMEKQTAWQQGLLLFDGESLTQVVEQLSRYTDRNIIIADPNIAELKIGGQFRTNEIDGVLDALSSGFGITVQYSDQRILLLGQEMDLSALPQS